MYFIVLFKYSILNDISLIIVFKKRRQTHNYFYIYCKIHNVENSTMLTGILLITALLKSCTLQSIDTKRTFCHQKSRNIMHVFIALSNFVHYN